MFTYRFILDVSQLAPHLSHLGRRLVSASSYESAESCALSPFFPGELEKVKIMGVIPTNILGEPLLTTACQCSTCSVR